MSREYRSGLGWLSVLVITGCAPAEIPEDAAFPRVSAEEVGFDVGPLESFDSLAADYVSSGRIAGVQAWVVKDGQLAHETMVGVMDLDSSIPLRGDAIFRIASQTKLVIGAATLILVEEGRLSLDDEVSRFIPAFATTTVAVPSGDSAVVVRADRPITIRDLLTHEAGIPGPVPTYFLDRYSEASLTQGKGLLNGLDEPAAEMVDRLAGLPFEVQPGERPVYGYSTDVLGVVIERASGLPLDEFLRSRLFEPLGMRDTYFFLPPGETDRLVANHIVADDGRLLRARDDDWSWDGQGAFVDGPRRLFSGNGGLLSTASDFARFLQMLLNEGAIEEGRVLSPSSVATLTSNHTGALYDEFWPGMGFGFSVEVKLDPSGEGAVVPRGASPGAFGWIGAAYTGFWADPDRGLIGIFLAQHRGTDLDLRRRFGDLVYSAALDQER